MPARTRQPGCSACRACSASHVGFCALRLESVWTALGQAAGVAARIAHRGEGGEAGHSRRGAGAAVAASAPRGSARPRSTWQTCPLVRRRSRPCNGSAHGVGCTGWSPRARSRAVAGRNIEGQYYEAFPGHAFEPDRPVDDALLQLLDRSISTKAPQPSARTLEADGRLTRARPARLFALAEREAPRVISTDVRVYGGTSGGVVAAAGRRADGQLRRPG